MVDFDNDYNDSSFVPVVLNSDQPFGTKIQRQPLNPEIPSEMHFHNCFEFVYVYSDVSCTLFTSDTVSLKSGDVMMISPHIPHRFTKKAVDEEALFGRTSFDVFFVDLELLNQCIDSFPEMWKTPLKNNIAAQYMVFHSDSQREICSHVYEIIKEMSLKHYAWYLDVASRILLLFTMIGRNSSNKKNALSTREKRICIQPALNYIKKNYAEPIYLLLLSELCHMSQATFGRKFKQIMGTTPLDYIHNLRVQRACVLLRSSEMSILEISLAVGFVSISSFNRQFRRLKGITPNQYRVMMPESQLTSDPLD